MEFRGELDVVPGPEGEVVVGLPGSEGDLDAVPGSDGDVDVSESDGVVVGVVEVGVVEVGVVDVVVGVTVGDDIVEDGETPFVSESAVPVAVAVTPKALRDAPALNVNGGSGNPDIAGTQLCHWLSNVNNFVGTESSG